MEPLMWTARGNVPVDSLKYSHRWAYDGQTLCLHETWHFEDGELARNNMHMLALPGAPIEITETPNLSNGFQLGAQQAAMQ